jgi:hypothetical protein
VPWTPDNDLLTPTMKVKRIDLRKKYRAQLSDLYRELRSKADADRRTAQENEGARSRL